MRRIFKSAAIAVAALAISGPAFADPPPVQTASASVTIYEQIRFAVLLEMDFGLVASSSTSGVVELNPSSNSRNCTGGSTCVGAYQFARLELSGSDANIRINYDPEIMLTGPGDPIKANPQFAFGQNALVPLTGGHQVYEFGAQLHVNAGQAPGPYQGTFNVDIGYE